MTKNIFSKNCSEKELKQRNVVLGIVKSVLWLTTTPTMFFFLIQLPEPSFGSSILTILLFIILVRFEFWSIHFWGSKYSRCGQDWVVSGLKDNPIYQEKLFTGKYHREGDLNPLW